MKKILTLALLLLTVVGGSVIAQCVPDTVMYPNGGFYPLPTNPLPTGTVNTAYSQVITVNVPADTTIDLSSLIGFPTPPITATINEITIGVVGGLPIGIFASTNPSSGMILGGGNGCIDLSGTPTTAGGYTITIPTTLNIQIPNGIPIIGGTAQNVPGSVPYTMAVSGGTAIAPVGASGFSVSQNLPNPTSGNTVIRYSVSAISDMHLQVVDATGHLVYSTQQNGVSGDQSFNVNVSDFAPGMYLYRISDGKNSVARKMVVLD
jgi:hypothetical protein